VHSAERFSRSEVNGQGHSEVKYTSPIPIDLRAIRPLSAQRRHTDRRYGV